MPRVWSFHNYGDFKTFALSGRRAARDLPIPNHFTRLYDGERYEWTDGTGERQPEIWVTEAGGVNYSFNCKSVPAGRRLKFCDDQDERIALLGMPRQASTLAFFLKAYGDRSGPPGPVGLIDRVYCFQLLTKAECGIKRLGDFKCSLSEFGLLGSDDDDLFRSAVQLNDRRYVVPAPPRSATEPNDRFYSKPGERRFSFCLLRDRSPRWLTKPSRINRSNCSR